MAHAQANSSAQQNREAAKEAFKKAESFYKINEYEKALESYKESYLLSQEPVLLYNMAQCYRLLGRHEEALRTYKSFIKDSPAKAKFVKEAKTFVKDLEELIKKQQALEIANPTTVAPANDPKDNLKPDPIEEPKSQPQTIATTTPSEEAPTPREERPPFLLVAAGTASLAAVSGVLSLSQAKQANEAATSGDFEGSAGALSTARIFGVTTDVLLGATLVNVGLAYLSSSAGEGNAQMGKVLAGGALGGAALTFVTGGLALRAAGKAEASASAGDFAASARSLSVSRALSTTAVLAGGLTLASGGVGLSMWDVEEGATPVPKFVAIGGAVGALAAGASSLSLANRATQQAEAGDFEASAATQSRARLLGATADVLGVATIAGTAAGALLTRRAQNKSTTAALSAAPGGVSLLVQF